MEPIRIHVKKRERRLEVTDGGGAVAAAGVAPRTLSFPDHIDFGDRSVNVSRKGVVFLAGWTAGSEEWLRALQELVAEGSLALYEALLEAVSPPRACAATPIVWRFDADSSTLRSRIDFGVTSTASSSRMNSSACSSESGRGGIRRTSSSADDARMFVSFFGFAAFTSRSLSREFSPTIIPS